MTARFVLRTLRRSPRRVLVGLLGVAVPVALFCAIAFFVDTASRGMTAQAVSAVQLDAQVLARTPKADMRIIDEHLAALRDVRHVERYAQVDLPVTLPDGSTSLVRVFAVDPSYMARYPWVHVTSGALAGGVLVADPLVTPATNQPGATVQLHIDGAAPISLPVTGSVDLSAATSWYALTGGDQQGDVVFVPGSIVVDYHVFEARLLAPLSKNALDPAAAAAAPTQSNGVILPGVVSLQAHLVVDRSILDADPTRALVRSTGLRRALERSSPGLITALDNVGENLNAARTDAINAKVLFLFLGIPGVLVAAALAVAAAMALAAAQRREIALLSLRGATTKQTSRLMTATGLTIGVVGSLLGVALGAGLVTIVLGASGWKGASATSVTMSGLLGAAVGMAVTFVSLRLTSRSARTASVVEQRRQLDVTWRPAWRRLRLDYWAIVVALVVLGVNALTGGSRRTTVEGVALAAGFYLLLAPIALWLGVTLVGVRGLATVLRRRTRPERSRPLTTWPASGFRWLGRRPGRTASAVIIGALAVAFGTNLLAFIGTYNSAKRTEAAISVGADVRVTPGRILPAPTPPVSRPDVASSVAVHAVVMTVGTDRRTAFAVDPAAYAKTVTTAMPDMSSGSRDAALRGMATDTTSVLVSRQFAKEFTVAVGDSIDATVLDAARKPVPVTLHVTGMFWTVAPTVPGADFLMNSTAVPPTALPAPDFYLVKVAPGHSVDQVASRFRGAVHGRQTWTVDTFRKGIGKNQSTLAKLNLAGLGRIETTGTLVIAALGLAVLGAFLVLERRREYAVMRSLGATTAQVLVPPGVEGLATVVASVLVGVPVGLLMAVLSVRVLTPLFTLRPPLLHADPLALGGLVAAVMVTTTLAFAGSLITVARLRTVSVLRET